MKIAELMVHQSILTTRRYTHATDEGQRAAEDCQKFATKIGRPANFVLEERSFDMLKN